MAGPPGGLSLWRNRFGDLLEVPGRRHPIKAKLHLVLGDRVSNRRLKLAEASCVTEMALMMEITTFFECAAKAEATPEESSGSSSSRKFPYD
uniref:Uncharacterized protein n=1 Tax=Laticauda laticaudata TaxID=8630 RepID=A0A8C5SIY6_LATLA